MAGKTATIRPKRITAKQKVARRKNIAIARKYRNKRRGATKSTKSIGWSGGNKPASGKGLKGVARYKRIAERSLYRIMQIQRNRDMSKLTKADQKKVRILSKTMTRFTRKYTSWRPETSVSRLRLRR